MLSRAYYPQKIDEVQAIWKQKLETISPSAANALGSTQTHPDCFPQSAPNNDEDYSDNDDEKDDIKQQIEENNQETKPIINTMTKDELYQNEDDNVLNGDDDEFDIDDLDEEL